MGSPETAVLVTSDWHYGKQTASYGPQTFRSRFESLGERLIQFRDRHLGGKHLDKLIVLILGDVCDGGGIYPTQPHHQEITDPQEQAWQLSGVTSAWLGKQREAWGEVEVFAVPGNHGRAGKHAHENTNFDVVFYRYLQGQAKEHGVSVNLNTADYFLQKAQIRGHHYLLYHGDRIYGTSGIPWYGVQNRLLRWNTSDSLGPIDVLCMGHFHALAHWRVNRVQVLATGTMVTDDQWALTTLGFDSANQWWLFGVSDKHPITWQYGLDLA
ncbi:MAG: hypothetical protein GX785_02185 [Armatimonadetes bacterium]|nr:hypothetical protein [Armatimonadota bacterium]